MAQQPKSVNLTNSHYLKSHASWLYCDGCNKTVAYLCYVTYSYFKFDYVCNCGSYGVAENIFDDIKLEELESGSLAVNPKNKRFCCGNDEEALFSVVLKNLKSYSATVVCKKCKTKYERSETI